MIYVEHFSTKPQRTARHTAGEIGRKRERGHWASLGPSRGRELKSKFNTELKQLVAKELADIQRLVNEAMKAQKGELEEIAVSPEGWAELEEIAGKREVGFPGKRMRSRSAVAHD